MAGRLRGPSISGTAGRAGKKAETRERMKPRRTRAGKPSNRVLKSLIPGLGRPRCRLRVIKSRYQISARAGILWTTRRLNSWFTENGMTVGTDSADIVNREVSKRKPGKKRMRYKSRGSKKTPMAYSF
jgi:hypothetical protein